MSSENATLVYKAAQEAQQKFEYFLTGAVGAMFAYIAQTYTPHKLGWHASTLEPVSLLFLAVAFFLGLQRINCIYHILGMSYEQLMASSDAKEISKALQQAEPHKDTLPPQQREYMEGWEKERDLSRDRAKQAGSHLEALNRKASAYYNARSLLLIAGFTAILAARVLAPYYP